MTALDPLSDDELLRRLHQAVQALPDAPVALQQAAIDLWPGPAASLPPLAGLAQAALRRLGAVLSFDSWAAPALAQGMRALRAPTRHLLFSTQGRDIDLRIAPAAGAFSLSGQILGPDEAGKVELAALPERAAALHLGTLDGLGEFRIEGVPPGRYRLSLRLGDDLIELPPLDIGETLPGPSVDGTGH